MITSGLMAAWINSGVDTQGGTKTSTIKEEMKKNLMKLLPDYFNVSYIKLF